MSNQLAFHNTTIQSINHNNQIWITSSDLANLLQYSNTKSVTNIYNRNNDEFTDKMTQVIKMVTSGNYQKTVRIFSLRGAHLLAMLANTDVAKEVRKWLLDLADKEIGIIETISIEQQQAIKRAVQERAYRTSEHYQAVYTKLYEAFKIPRYQDLPATQFDNAIKFLGGVSTKPNCLTSDELCDFAWLYKAAEHMRSEIEEIEPSLRILKSEKATMYYTMSREYRHVIQNCKRIVQDKMKTTSINRHEISWQRVLPFIQ